MRNSESVKRSTAGLPLALTLVGLLGVVAVRPPAARAQASKSEFVPTFSTNSRVRQQVDRLVRLSGQKLWDEWLATYQQLVDDPNDLVIVHSEDLQDDEFLVGIRYYCHQQLSTLPAAVRQRYRALHDAEAGRMYEKAAAENDVPGMREIYSRYRFTSSGPRALLWMANRGLDDGRPELARVAYSRLAKDPGVAPSTLIRYALAADAAGKPAEARSVLDRVRKEFGAQQVRLEGKNVTGAAAADTIAKTFRKPADANESRWPAFGGSAGDRKMTGGLRGGLKPLWETPMGAVAEGNTPRFSTGSSRRFAYLTFPTVEGNRVWLQSPRGITALERGSGKPIWDRQDFTIRGEEIPKLGVENRRGYPSNSGVRPVQAAPSVDGNLLVTRMPLTLGDRQTGQWPADFAITALDRRTGSTLWQRTAGGDPRGTFFNIPTLHANTVFTGIATNKGGITEYNAVALDAGTGETLWSTYLGAGSDPLMAVDGSPPAVKDGLVWIESSLYTLNAVDMITGEVRLIYKYDPVRRSNGRGDAYSTPVVPNDPISLIAAGAGPIVFAPRWGVDVVAISPTTGRLLWSSPKAPGSTVASGALFGVDQKHAYICGDYLQAINLADGSRDWTWVDKPNVGYAALAGERIYAPVDGRLQVFNAADGSQVEELDSSKEVGELRDVISVTVVDGTLLVATRDKLIAYSAP